METGYFVELNPNRTLWILYAVYLSWISILLQEFRIQSVKDGEVLLFQQSHFLVDCIEGYQSATSISLLCSGSTDSLIHRKFASRFKWQ